MVQKLVFDPQTLIEEEKEKEEKKTKDALTEQEEFDRAVEKENAKVDKQEAAEERKGFVSEVFTGVKQRLKEVNYYKKYGGKKYLEAKRKEDPNDPMFDPPLEKIKQMKEQFSDIGSAIKQEVSSEAKAYTLAETKDPEVKVKEKPSVFDDLDVNNVGVSQAIMASIISGGIKFGAGFFQFGAMLKDAFAEEGIPVSESNLAKFNKVFEESYIGLLGKHSEEIARERAIGRLTELGIQLYGGWKTGGKFAINMAEKMTGVFNKAVQAYKKGRYIKATGNKNLYKAAKEVKKLNQLSDRQKFWATAVGGGMGTAAVIYKSENVGTLGDLAFKEGEYLAMNRERAKDAKADAIRQLYNKLKLGAELSFPIIPAIVQGGKIGNLILKKSRMLEYSNKAFERRVDKFISRPLRARGPFQADQFKAIQRMEGAKESGQLIAKDYLKRFDKIIHTIEKKALPASRASGLTDSLSESFIKFINRGKFATSKGKIIAQGYSTKTINEFMKTMTKDLKINPDDAVALIDEFYNVQKTWADFLNIIYKGRNVNVSKNEFTQIINDRIKNSLSLEFKIFGDKSLKAVDEFAPAASVKDQVANIFMRSAKENGKVMSKGESLSMVNDIIKNVRLEPTTNMPSFKFGTRKVDPLNERAVATKNIADNITGGGKFKPDKDGGLIRTKKDLEAFKKLFGEYQNAEKIISNVTNDLASITARDGFYNFIKQRSKEMVKNGERGIVYDSYDEAVRAFPNKKIVDASTGLDVPSGLGKEAYTPPINGMFTTDDIAQGLINGSKDALGGITKSALYQWGILIQKSLVQAGKTDGGQFTHARNFSSGAITTVYLGNIAIPPKELAKAVRTAWRTTQAQILTKNRPGLNISATRPRMYGANTTDPTKLVGGKEFVEEGGQSLYRFLLDEGMVNSSARAREVEMLISDTTKTGFLQKVWKRLGNKTQKFLKGAQELYIAEDDAWKIFNFFGESYRIRSAYEAAIRKGIIKLKDVPGGSLDSIEILQMATKKVRDMLPNYNYVSPAIKGVRKSPLGNFVGWTSEQLRTFPNAVRTALDEINSPIFKKMGYQRLAGMATTLATIPPLAVWGAMQVYGFTEKKLDALREFLPIFSKKSTVLPIYENGEYKYIDFSRGFFYETLTSPIQTIFTTIEMQPDKPTLPLLYEGMGKATWKILEPFIGESIWVGAWADIFARGGEDKLGTRVWNPEDDPGDKVVKTMQHLSENFSIGSAPAVKRVIAALSGQTINGVEYELSDELLGLLGFRVAPLDIERSLNFKLNEFMTKERNQRSLMLEKTRTGDPVEGNKLIKQMIEANEKRYETFNSIRRTIDAALFLGIPEDKIRDVFKRRGQKKLFDKIMDNEWYSMGISKGIEKGFEYTQEKYNIPPTYDDYTKDTIRDLQDIMDNLPLNQPWRIKPKDWLKKDIPTKIPEGEGWERIGSAPLPPTPGVDQQVVVQAPQQAGATGLTATETALLSNEEKAMRLRQRGLA